MSDSVEEVLFRTQPEQYGAQYELYYMEIYKTYLATADAISTRRQKANAFFLTVNTAIVGVLGYSNPCLQQTIGHLIWVISISGMLLSYTWYRVIRSYKGLNSAKFRVIHLIESKLPLAVFDAEWEAVGRGRDRKKYLPFTRVEMIVPWIFLALHLLIFAFAFPWSPLCAVVSGKP